MGIEALVFIRMDERSLFHSLANTNHFEKLFSINSGINALSTFFLYGQLCCGLKNARISSYVIVQGKNPKFEALAVVIVYDHGM